jgi:peptide/nickel transport system permease protein
VRTYVLRRVLLMIPTLIGVAVLVFVLMRLLPGDIVALRVTGEGGFVSEETIRQERERLGIDRPVWRQFADWVWGLAHLDLGRSMWTGRPVTYEIGIRFQLSLQVALLATLVAIVLAIPLGTIAALWQDTWVDYGVRLLSIAGLATPSFWLGIVMLLAFLALFEWTPPMVYTPFWVDPWRNPPAAHLAPRWRRATATPQSPRA